MSVRLLGWAFLSSLHGGDLFSAKQSTKTASLKTRHFRGGGKAPKAATEHIIFADPQTTRPDIWNPAVAKVDMRGPSKSAHDVNEIPLVPNWAEVQLKIGTWTPTRNVGVGIVGIAQKGISRKK